MQLVRVARKPSWTNGMNIVYMHVCVHQLTDATSWALLMKLGLVQAIELLIQRLVNEDMNGVLQHAAGASPVENTLPESPSSHGRSRSEDPAEGVSSVTTEIESISAQQSNGNRSEAVIRKPPRNKACTCGSNQKYKNCCGALVAAAACRQKAALLAGQEAGVAVERMQTLFI